MIMYSMHIGIALYAIGFAAGLVALYYGGILKADLIKWAGWFLTVVSALGFVCILYYSSSYFFSGSFKQAYGPGMAHNCPMGGMMNGTATGSHMMNDGTMMENGLKDGVTTNQTKK